MENSTATKQPAGRPPRSVAARAAVVALAFILGLITLARLAVGYGETRLGAMADQYDNLRSTFADRQETVVRTVASLIAVHPDVLDDYETTQQFLQAVSREHEDISVCYIVNLDWDIPVIMDNGWMPPADYPIAERPWYTGALEADGELCMTSPYYDEQSGSYCCTLSVLVRRAADESASGENISEESTSEENVSTENTSEENSSGENVSGENSSEGASAESVTEETASEESATGAAAGEVLGILAADFYLDKLVGILTQSYTDDGYAFLIDEAGNILNHPNEAYQMTDTSVTNLADTPYAGVLAGEGTKLIRDCDGRLAVCRRTDTSGYHLSVVAVETWQSVYGTVLLTGALLMILFIICIVWIILQSRRYAATQAAANTQLTEALTQARAAGEAKTKALEQAQAASEAKTEALKQAQAASEAKTEFISRISHDIRTPIGAILNLSDFARQDLHDPEKLSDDIDRIRSSGTFLLSLINDVLDISKVDAGRIELHPEPYDYREYIRDLKNILEPMCSEKGVQLTMEEQHTDRHYILVDKVRLRQVALNILSNAVKYTPAGGSVTYRSGAEPLGEDRIRFTMTVTDTGIGMSEEFVKTIFDEFTQETDNPARESGMTGTGLGMSIVKKMVELMGGEIRIDSRLGEGTTVAISLPVQTITDEEAEKILGIDSAHRTEDDVPLNVHILLAEDNEINTMIALRTFGEMGVTVEHAANGQEALDTFAASAPEHFRAVFMDIQMPVMDGYEAARAIRALDRSDAAAVPIIAMTADAYTSAMDKARDAGMSGFLTKPLDAAKIRQTLVQHLGL